MSLSLFHATTKTHYREQSGGPDTHEHSFGGEPTAFGLKFVRVSPLWRRLGWKFVALKKPLHLLYRLNLNDPAIPIRLPGITWLPLCYAFGYSAFDGKCIYRVVDDSCVELIWPEKPKFDPNFPYPKYPSSYPQSSVRFEQAAYDSKQAMDALSLAAVFGVDELPAGEMEKAIKYVAENTDLMEMWCGEKYGWEPASVVESMYPRPFMQGAPSRECENPHCSAEVVRHTTATTFEVPGIDTAISLPSRPVRRDSLATFALYESEIRDSPVLDDIQLSTAMPVTVLPLQINVRDPGNQASSPRYSAGSSCSTSSVLVTPCATFSIAPRRNSTMPLAMAAVCSSSAGAPLCSRCRSLRVIVMISKTPTRPW